MAGEVGLASRRRMRSPSTGTGRKEKTGEDTGRGCAGRSGDSGLEKHLSEKQEGDAGRKGQGGDVRCVGRI